MSLLGAFLEQNDLAAATITAEQRERIDQFAEHHSGNLIVLGASVTGGRYVKCHDSWGDEGVVVVHEYNPESTNEPDEVREFTTGCEAVDEFLRRVGPLESDLPLYEVEVRVELRARDEDEARQQADRIMQDAWEDAQTRYVPTKWHFEIWDDAASEVQTPEQITAAFQAADFSRCIDARQHLITQRHSHTECPMQGANQ